MDGSYAAHELEILAIVDTLRAWRSYTYGKKTHHLFRSSYFTVSSSLISFITKTNKVVRLIKSKLKQFPYKGNRTRLPMLFLGVAEY